MATCALPKKIRRPQLLQFLRSRQLRVSVAALSLASSPLLSGCGSISIWPFGGDIVGKPRVVPNATQYLCGGGKGFHLRMLADGAAWVIYPDREVRLDKASAGGATRYGNGIATLEINGADASLTDGPGISYAGCKPVSGAPATK